ncbi:MAG: LL-diaminopimelate aminotransferase, partial [Lentisphaerae bacterium]|nr:LL-diaminopimelate aminotransferase [Lentisphaerota bacterium]
GAGAVDFASAEEAAEFLIREHLVSTVPWDEAGAFLRFSATFSATGGSAYGRESASPKDDDRVLAELLSRLAQARLRF